MGGICCYCLPVYAQRSVFSLLGPPIIYYDLLGLADVQDEIIPETPTCQIVDFSIVHLLTEEWLSCRLTAPLEALHDVMFVLWHRNNAGGLQAGGECRKLQGQVGNDQKYSAQHIISGLT